MTTLRRQIAVEFSRIVEVRARLRPWVNGFSSQEGISGRFRGGLGTSFGSRMASTSPDYVADRIRRVSGPLQIRKLSNDGESEQVQGVTAKTRSTAVREEVACVKSGRKLARYDPVSDQGKHRTSAWPWISVIPYDSSGYIGRIQKGKDVGKEQSVPEAGDAGSLQSSPLLFPLIHRSSGAKSPLNLLPINVPEKICNILSKYRWSAHTLLELRTLLAECKQLKPRQILDVLTRQRHADVAFNFLQWALKEANCRLDIKCFTVVMPLLGRVRKYDMVQKVLEDLENNGYTVDRIILTAAMRCYAEGQRMQEALEMFIKIKERGFKPDCVTYSVLMQMFSKAKLYQEALKLYEEMLALGVATDTQVYNCVVSTFGKAGRLDLAYKKLEEMRERGHIPDQFTYGVLLEGYVKAGRLAFLDLYREMKNAGIPLNEVIFNIMFLGIERIGTLKDAEDIFADMERMGLSVNLNAFSTLIGMCSKKGDSEGAQHWFNKMTSMGLQPTLAVGNSLLDSYAKTKSFAQAEQVLDAFEKWRIVPNLTTLTVCLRCLSICERPEDLEIVQKMLSCHSGSKFLSSLLDRSDEENAARTIASFLGTLHSERRQKRRDFVNVLINYLYKSGFRSHAYQVWEGALENYVFSELVEQGPEGICSINLRDMECGTAVIALTHTLPRLSKQFHRIEMAPDWVQIYTVNAKEGVPNRDPSSLHQTVDTLLQNLHSPFHVGTLETGGGFVCRGQEVMHWLDEPQVKAMLAFKHQ